MSNFNVLCSCYGFHWAGNLSCTWIITENWSILAIEDSFVNFVGKVDNIFQEFYFCDSLKQNSVRFLPYTAVEVVKCLFTNSTRTPSSCLGFPTFNIDEKQNFIFNQQALFFWTDLESNGFQEIWESKLPFSSRFFQAIDALFKYTHSAWSIIKTLWLDHVSGFFQVPYR